MWDTNTYWFDVSVAMTVFMLGQLCFGRFVEYQSRGRRFLKTLLGAGVLLAVSAWAGRGWMYVLLASIVTGVGVVHAWWLPRKGINGWTAEPRARYNELMGLDSAGKRLARAGS